MTGRSKTGGFSEDLAKAPGPGAYQHVRPDVTKRKAPGYSMLGRSYMPGGENVFINWCTRYLINRCMYKPHCTNLLNTALV